MGTYWSVDLAEEGVSFSKEFLSQKIIGMVDLYDKTFSDWRPDSELRNLEKKHLTNFQKPSGLFLKGLEYSLLAFNESKGNFDITTGAVIWRERDKKLGLNKIILKKDGFEFVEDPKRLTFGGIVKGMAVGKIANWLYLANIKNFRVNAGDGNLVISGKNFKVGWEEEVQTGAIKPDEVIFVSRNN
jgi:thiamine biosynthesis lipoprotein ApbE